MSFAGLLNQTATVYRPTQTSDEYGDMPFVFTEQGTTKLRLAPPAGALTDLGPGEQQSDRLVAFLPPAADVLERDVIEVDTGPGTGRRWRVLNAPALGAMGPATHHFEAQVEPYSGPLEVAGVSP